MTEREPLTIYVRRRKIMRNGQRVDGWQSSLNINHRSGGPTSTEREAVIEHYRDLAKRYGRSIERIVDL